MADTNDDPTLALYELYLATAERVSDRRAQANSWMLSVNSAIVVLYGYLQADKTSVGAAQKAVWALGHPGRGRDRLFSLVILFTSYRELNSAKFAELTNRSRPANPAIYTRTQAISSRPPPILILC